MRLAICLLVMSACGIGGSGPDARVGFPTVDAREGEVCNVLLNARCAAGQKCTWIRLSVSPPLGQVACVADGTVAPGGSCAYGGAGATTGFDNCTGGNICFANPEEDQASGTCREICSLTDDLAPCETGFVCGEYERFFSNSDTQTPIAGVCDARR